MWHDQYSRDPADVVNALIVRKRKVELGCAACVHRDLSMMIFNRAVCGVPGRFPGRHGYCDKWHHDEGVKNGHSD